jgi:hypothetical protein
MNILSLVSQNLDNFYQIQTKWYRNSDTVFFFLIHRTKRGLGKLEGGLSGLWSVCVEVRCQGVWSQAFCHVMRGYYGLVGSKLDHECRVLHQSILPYLLEDQIASTIRPHSAHSPIKFHDFSRLFVWQTANGKKKLFESALFHFRPLPHICSLVSRIYRPVVTTDLNYYCYRGRWLSRNIERSFILKSRSNDVQKSWWFSKKVMAT